MDAVELSPLPPVPKPLFGEEKGRGSGAGGGRGCFDGIKGLTGVGFDGMFSREVADHGRVDREYPTASSKNRYSTSTKDGLLDSLFLSTSGKVGKSQCTEEARSSILFSPKHEAQHRQKKSLKRSITPISTEPTMDQPENLSSCPTKCTPCDKPKVFRQRNAQDGKRSDRKNGRFSGKTKLDSFISKEGLQTSDVAGNGKHILGIYGLKTDSHDVTRDVDELLLSELLDGSYRCPSPCKSKGKRGQTVNANFMQTVRKACAVLPVHNSVYCKLPNSPLTTSSSPTSATGCDVEEKFVDNGVPSTEESNCETLSDIQLHQPMDVLKRLKLPMNQDLDSVTRDLDIMISASSCSAKAMLNVDKTRLVPFSWSLSHAGPSKPSLDTCKLANRSMSQGKWVRLGSHVDYCSSSSVKLDKNLQIASGSSSKHLSYNDLLLDVKTSMDFSILCDKSPSVSSDVRNVLKSEKADEPRSSNGFGSLRSGNSANLGLLNTKNNSIGSCFKCSSKGIVDGCKQNQEKTIDFLCLSSSKLEFCMKTGTKERHDTDGLCSNNSCHFHKYISIGCNKCLQQSCSCKTPPKGCSLELLTAAETLSQMSRELDISWKWKFGNEKITVNGAARQISVNNKPCSLLGKKHGPPNDATSGSVGTVGEMSSHQQKALISCKKSRLSNSNGISGRHIRWTVTPSEKSYPVKRGGIFMTNGKHTSGNFAGQGSSSIAIQVENGSSSHPELKKGNVVTTPYAVASACGKDWNGGKSKKT